MKNRGIKQSAAYDMGKLMSHRRDEILTTDEVLAYLHAGKGAVPYLATNGPFPAFELGYTLRFRCGDLEQWIASRVINAIVESEEEAQ